MKTFLAKHRYSIPIAIVLVIILLLVAVPYLLPVSSKSSTVPVESLVTSSGKFLSIGPNTIYVEDQGSSSENAVVLIHGFGGSTFSWRNNASFLANQGFRVIALDLKGFGLSSRGLQSDYSHKAQASLVSDVLQELGISRAYFVGHSMGSSVMFHFAHLYPDKVRGLVSVDGAINLTTGSRIPSMLLYIPPFQRAGRAILTNYISKEKFLSTIESAYYRKEVLTSDVIDGYYNRAIRDGWDESLLGMTRSMPENTINFAWNTLNYRTLVIRGEQDTWVSLADTEAWKKQITNAEYYPIPDSGHLPMEEQPAIFNEKVLNFLRY